MMAQVGPDRIVIGIQLSDDTLADAIAFRNRLEASIRKLWRENERLRLSAGA